MKNNRDRYWDIVKGIGIVCVVLGHSFKSTSLIAFVYLFHLPLFFFVSGFFYNEERYGDDLPALIGHRITSIMPRYMLYAALLVLLHNPLVSCGAIAGEIYDHTHMLWSLGNYAVFTLIDSNAGPLWFITVWMISQFIFGAIVSIVRHVFHGTIFRSEGVKAAACSARQKTVSTVIIVLISMIVSAAGVFLMVRDMKINLYFEVALAVVVVVLLGYLLRAYIPQFRKYTKWYWGILCALLLVFIQKKFGVFMDMASNSIKPQWFLITSVLGIIFCLVLSEYIEKIPAVRSVFALLGRESFDIMALHFTVFKLIDIVYVKLHPECADRLIASPISFAAELWWVYLILGLAVPAAIGLGLDRVKTAIINHKLKSENDKG